MKQILLCLFALGLSACSQNSQLPDTASSASSATTSAVADKASWKEYQNEKYGINFSYPSDWEIHESNSATSDLRIEFQSSDTKARITEAMKHPEIYEGTDGYGPNTDLEIVFCAEFKKSDCTFSTLYWYSVETMNYKSLTDMFSDTIYNHVEKVGERTISGKKAYEVRLPESFEPFGILVEHNQGVFVFKFSHYTSGGIPSKSSIEEAIISTVQLQ
jgi:hypothetical protein